MAYLLAFLLFWFGNAEAAYIPGQVTPAPTATPVDTPVPTATAVNTATPAFTPTLVPTATPFAGANTPTPIVFGTPGNIVVFGNPELQPYPGNACLATQAIQEIDASGNFTCIEVLSFTPTPRATDTPQPTPTLVPTATPQSGASAYSTIQDEGTPLPQEQKLNCIGSLVTCADDAGNTRTNLTVSDPTARATDTPQATPTLVPTATPQPTATPGSGGIAHYVVASGSTTGLSGTTPQHIALGLGWMSAGTASACISAAGNLLTLTHIPDTMTITGMRCETTNSQTGGTVDWYIGKYSSCTAGTIPKNAAGSGNTTVTCQGTSGNSGACSVTGVSEAYSAGDYLQVMANPASPTTAGTLTWECVAIVQ